MMSPAEERRKSKEAKFANVRGPRFVRENPVGFILCGLAIGIVAGTLAPVTRIEREKLAPVREEFIEHAQKAVSDVIDHSKLVIQETTAAASASATKHGQELIANLQQDLGSESNRPDADRPALPS